jgi:hypothetical protein
VVRAQSISHAVVERGQRLIRTAMSYGCMKCNA